MLAVCRYVIVSVAEVASSLEQRAIAVVHTNRLGRALSSGAHSAVLLLAELL